MYLNVYDVFHASCLRLMQATTYPKSECEALISRLMNWHFGVGKVDILIKKNIEINTEQYTSWEAYLDRLSNYEPLQYITKTVNFADFEMFVNPNVLIPRPETEEWVLFLLDICKKQGFLPTAILDVCTGSGCIANTLALHFPQASVEGWDISKEAISVGKENAQRLGAKVNFREIDFLKEATLPDFDCKELLLVSNPPYIPTSERVFMQRNVLDYEPDVALFVPNETPLIFYECLAYLAQRLQPCLLMIEIHENFAEQVMALFSNAGFGDIKLHTDFHGKARAVWSS